jgi:glyceraldehyde 3-phosphate dehydrogenase
MPATYLGARVAGYRPPRPMRVGILGAFGTIGRASLLALSRREDKAFFRVSFLHDRLSDIERAVRLLRNPSAYETGIDVKVGDAKTLLLEDAEVKCYYDAAPSDLPLSEVDLVLDCTGKHNRGQDLRQYLPADGVLLLPAFSHQMDANLIIGFNDREFDPSRHRMVGIGSCSMNAVVLVLGIIRELGLESAVLSVLHCADRDQSVVDVVSHKDPLGMSSLGGFFTIDSRSLM